MRLAPVVAVVLVGCTAETGKTPEPPPVVMSTDCEEFVRDAVPAGSDLRAIVAAAAPGGTILVGPGAFRGPLEISAPGVTIRGTCPAVTFIDADVTTAVQVHAADAYVEDLTIRGGTPGIVVAGTIASANLRHVVVEGATGQGVQIGPEGGLTAEDLVIRGTDGRGLTVLDFATADVTRATIEGSVGLGVFADGDASLVLRDSTVTGTAPDASGALGHGVHAQGGADVTVTGSVIEGSQDGGVVAIDADLTIERTRVAGTLPGPRGTGDGIGFFLGPEGEGGRALAVNDVELADNTRAGVIVDGEVGQARVAGGSISGGAFATVAQEEAVLVVEGVDVEPGLPSLEGAEGSAALPVDDQPVD
jgi:hypothetical protein